MTTNKSLPNILANIALVWVAIILCFSVNAKVARAEENSSVFAKYRLVLNVQQDLTAYAELTVDMTNQNLGLISAINLTIPFTGISDTQLTIDGLAEEVSAQQAGDATNVTGNFAREAVLPGSAKELLFTFHTGEIVQSSYGINQLNVHEIFADHTVSEFILVVKYPASFPALIYTSNQNLANDLYTVQMSAPKGALIQWSNEAAADISGNLPVNMQSGGDFQLVNLISSLENQSVSYHGVSNLGAAGIDKVGNLWGIIRKGSQPMESDLLWERTGLKALSGSGFARIDYGSSPLPEELRSLSEDNRGKLAILYSYLQSTFKARLYPDVVNVDVNALNSKLSDKSVGLTPLEFAVLAARYASELGIDSHIVYGYFVTPAIRGFDSVQPYVWTECLDGNRIVLLDPYLGNVTGFSFFDAPLITRITMGIWDPSNEADSVLGMLSNAMRPRPGLNTASILPIESDYLLRIDMPETVYSGLLFEGTLTVKNNSDQFLPIMSLQVNGEDYTDRYLKITDSISRVMIPFADNVIRAEWLREPNMLTNESRLFIVSIVPDALGVPVLSASATIKFLPNNGLLAAILAAVMILVGTILAVVIKLSYPRRRRGKKTTSLPPMKAEEGRIHRIGELNT